TPTSYEGICAIRWGFSDTLRRARLVPGGRVPAPAYYPGQEGPPVGQAALPVRACPGQARLPVLRDKRRCRRNILTGKTWPVYQLEVKRLLVLHGTRPQVLRPAERLRGAGESQW